MGALGRALAAKKEAKRLRFVFPFISVPPLSFLAHQIGEIFQKCISNLVSRLLSPPKVQWENKPFDSTFTTSIISTRKERGLPSPILDLLLIQFPGFSSRIGYSEIELHYAARERDGGPSNCVKSILTNRLFSSAHQGGKPRVRQL